MRTPMALALALCCTPPVLAQRVPDPEAISRRLEAFVATGGNRDDDVLVLAREAISRCRSELERGAMASAGRQCGLAEAALVLAKERALLALARARSEAP